MEKYSSRNNSRMAKSRTNTHPYSWSVKCQTLLLRLRKGGHQQGLPEGHRQEETLSYRCCKLYREPKDLLCWAVAHGSTDSLVVQLPESPMLLPVTNERMIRQGKLGHKVFFGLLLCTKSRKFVFSLKRKYFCTGILSVCLSMHLELLVPMTARERHQIPWITEHVSHHLGGSNQTQFLWKINQPVL